MKHEGMTLKRTLASPAHEGELQTDKWIPACAGMTAKGVGLVTERMSRCSFATWLMMAMRVLFSRKKF